MKTATNSRALVSLHFLRTSEIFEEIMHSDLKDKVGGSVRGGGWSGGEMLGLHMINGWNNCER